MIRGSILLVDDEPKIREALAGALRDEGLEAVATGSPREALRLLAERPFDLLVVDNLMPELSGLDLIREVVGTMPAGERPATIMMVRSGRRSKRTLTTRRWCRRRSGSSSRTTGPGSGFGLNSC
jgi:CheY-like chemotaxis protein